MTALRPAATACRVKAIELAVSRLPADGTTRLSINFKPQAVYEPAACIRATLAAADSDRGGDLRLGGTDVPDTVGEPGGEAYRQLINAGYKGVH